MGAASWASLEERVESEVATLRGLVGAGPLWSPTLCERLRQRCASHGPLAFAEQRQTQSTGASGELHEDCALVGGGPLSTKMLSSLMGATSRDDRCAFAWVYRFADPDVAVAHLSSHPAFGAHLSEMSDGSVVAATDPAAAATRVAIVLAPSPTGRQSSGGPRGSVGRFQICTPRVVVAVIIWHADLGREPPLGPDLPALAEALRRDPPRINENQCCLHDALTRLYLAVDDLSEVSSAWGCAVLEGGCAGEDEGGAL
mmetsp:Transcript_80152/g.212739  ORF Transcript_80152/g.212739 Transcript_80152/m.212739 type:complete len:257 (-) Transcript_80152:192-962(-)